MTWLVMTSMVLLGISSWVLLRPLARVGGGQHGIEQWHQLGLVRDRLLAQIRELEKQVVDGVLDQATARDERLRLEAELAPVLRELESAQQQAAAGDDIQAALPVQKRRLWWLAALCFVIPVTSGLYLINGWDTLQGLYGPDATPRPSAQATSQMVAQMVQRLERRLQSAPQDPQGWAQLGRAYGVLDRKDEAQSAYARAYRQAPDDKAIVSAYAGYLYQLNPGNTQGEVRALYTQLRKLEPEHPGVLWFFGVVAYEQDDFKGAVASWKKLMRFLPQESRARTVVEQAVTDAQARIDAEK